jgi:hypothetical protein
VKSLPGRSGTRHEFSEVILSSGGPRVLQRFSEEISLADVLSTRAKSMDVDAGSVSLEAPSITPEAAHLARSHDFEVLVAPAGPEARDG